MTLIWDKEGNGFLRSLYEAIREASAWQKRNTGSPIRDKTIRNYLYGLRRALGKYPMEVGDLEVVKDSASLITAIKAHTSILTVQRNILTALIVVVRACIAKSILGDEYNDALTAFATEYKRLNSTYQETIHQEQKTKKDLKNMLPFENLGKMVSTMNKHLKYDGVVLKGNKVKADLTSKEYDALQAHLVLSLYYYLPCRRNEYGNMRVVSYDEFKEISLIEKEKRHYEQSNFLVLGKKRKTDTKFVFNNYKTRKLHGVQVVSIPRKLVSIIHRFLLANTSGHFLVNPYQQTPMTNNGLGKYIQKIVRQFYPTKRVGSCILRKMYISEVFKNDTSQKLKEDLAQMMGHTVSTQHTYLRR